MQIELSPKAILTIESELETTDQEIAWELSRLTSCHKGEETDIYRYWKERQRRTTQVLSEFKKAIAKSEGG